MAGTQIVPFSLWLKARRKELDLTQWQLAERIGCSEITVAKIEAGERRPSQQVAELLADILGIPDDERLAFIRYARRDAHDPHLAPVPITAPDAPVDRTPWRAVHLGQTNLPATLTPPLGREPEEEAIRRLMLRKGMRLLTLVGSPGIGKTRLAIAGAEDLLDEFEDGVFFVNLAPVSRPEMVIPAIANALAVRESGAQPLRDTLLAYLQGKRMLLLLDNFEQVLDAGVDVVGLLEGCPWLRVLITSRESLHVRGEHPFAVPPLPLPDLAKSLDPESLAHNPAVALFVERAQAASLDFELTQENAHSVLAVCVELDGMPLAIELAAARANLLSPAQILEALRSWGSPRSGRLEMLAGGWRDLPPRQQTLRNAIDWSYDLLDPGEQMLFSRLGIFVGGCSLEAARRICNPLVDENYHPTTLGPEPILRRPLPLIEIDVLEGTASLLNKSLLLQAGAPKAESRFTMLETIREYALERLDARSETEELHRSHAAYYLEYAQAAEAQSEGPQQTLWLSRLDLDYGNLGAALEWALHRRDAQNALRLAGSLFWYWDTRNLMTEGRKWLEGALAIDRGEPDALRAKALFGTGTLAFWQTDHERARSALQESLALYRKIGDNHGVAEALDMLGLLAREKGDVAQSIRLHEESLPLRQKVGDTRGIAYTLSQLGKAALYDGEYQQGAQYLADGLALRRQIGNINGIAASLNMLGWAMVHQADYARARDHFEEGLEVCRQLGDKHIEASMRKGLGFALLLQAEQPDPRVRDLFERSLASYRVIGDKVNIIEGLEAFAVLASAESAHPEHAARAARLFGACEALRNAIGTPLSRINHLLYEPLAHRARAALGTVRYTELWQQGQGMTMEQAISYALAGGQPG